jgi:hypothetical protein
MDAAVTNTLPESSLLVPNGVGIIAPAYMGSPCFKVFGNGLRRSRTGDSGHFNLNSKSLRFHVHHLHPLHTMPTALFWWSIFGDALNSFPFPFEGVPGLVLPDSPETRWHPLLNP